MERGVLGGTYLGFRRVETDLCAAALVMGRDITTQPYGDKLREGAICTIRYGLGNLRPDAVARIINC